MSPSKLNHKDVSFVFAGKRGVATAEKDVEPEPKPATNALSFPACSHSRPISFAKEWFAEKLNLLCGETSSRYATFFTLAFGCLFDTNLLTD